MQLIEDSFAADIPLAQDVHVGVVGSGDLEILVTSPTTPGRTTVTVRTSVDGFDTVWRRILARFFERHALEADVNQRSVPPRDGQPASVPGRGSGDLGQ